MSPEANSKSKGGKANANANNDADSIMPLLFATIGNPAISFKEMAAMDELGRTESSLEHRFRKWRQKGREIAAKNSAHAGALRTSNAAAATTKKPRISAKKGADGSSKGPIEQAGVEDEEDEEGETNEMSGIGGELLHPSSKGSATATNSTKKHTPSLRVAATEGGIGNVSPQKAKVVKKGIAKVVKKYKPKLVSSSEEEDAKSRVAEDIPTKPERKRKGKVAIGSGRVEATAKPTGRAKAKKGKAAGTAEEEQTRVPEDEDTDVDMDSGGGHHRDGMVDMQFDLAA